MEVSSAAGQLCSSVPSGSYLESFHILSFPASPCISTPGPGSLLCWDGGLLLEALLEPSPGRRTTWPAGPFPSIVSQQPDACRSCAM
jgi:hypothetical protein